MKLIKNAIPLVLATVLTVSFTACTKPAAKAKTPKPEKQTEETNVKTVDKVSEDLYDFQVSVDGVVYQLPCPFSKFEKNGWVGEDFDSTTMKPDQYIMESVKKGDKTMTIKIVNNGQDTASISKCNVGAIQMDQYNEGKDPKFVLAKEISRNSTYEQVVAAYGEPSEISDLDSMKIITYQKDTYATLQFYLDKASNSFTKLTIENMIPEERGEVKASGETPDVVKKYKAPAELGDNLLAFNVRYGGDLYKLPIPLTEFVKNGWKLVNDGNESIKAGDSRIGVELMKDNQVLRITVQNYADKATTINNCFATQVIYSINGPKTSIELPKGITENSTLAQIETAFGTPTKVENSGDFTYYTYGKIWEQVVITQHKTEGNITKIEVEYSPKDLE